MSPNYDDRIGSGRNNDTYEPQSYSTTAPGRTTTV
jgi:hypothetical protein